VPGNNKNSRQQLAASNISGNWQHLQHLQHLPATSNSIRVAARQLPPAAPKKFCGRASA